jgi:hypothetical protein
MEKKAGVTMTESGYEEEVETIVPPIHDLDDEDANPS